MRSREPNRVADHEQQSWLVRNLPITVKKKLNQWTAYSAALPTLHLGMLLLFVWVGLAGLSYAVDKTEASPSQAQTGKLQLIELFTSHGCSSCPAADRLLGELLAQNDELLALEYHVDYWNELVHGSDGNFIDPFSSPEYSLRQRDYNAAQLAGRPGVYTPQAVINGTTAAVGSNRRQLQKALDAVANSPLTVTFSDADAQAQLTVRVTGAAAQRAALDGVDVMLVGYLDIASTQITGGENRDLELVNHHVVMSVAKIGEISGSGEMVFAVDRPVAGHGCVVMVQEGASTPVHAAAECP